MWTLICDFFRIIGLLIRPGGVKSLITEIYLLRRQLKILMRKKKVSKSPPLKSTDRLFFGFLYFFIPKKKWNRCSLLLKPATILNFHKALVNRKYSILFRNKTKRKPGPKGPSKDLIKLVLEIKKRNPHMGCPQIADLISNNFDFSIDDNTVSRILKKYLKPDPENGGPSWLNFIGNTADSLWSIDFFCVESVLLKTHWVLIVMDQYSRRIIGIAVHCGPLNGPCICEMFNSVIRGKRIPKYLSMDNDPLFNFDQWQRNLRILDVKSIRSVPNIPWSHPFVESLIGKVRFEYTDRILFWNKNDIERKLNSYLDYYNKRRVHSSLGGKPPSEFLSEKSKSKATLQNYKWRSHCKGMFQVPIAA